ncbi:MAG: hypothetical protein P8J91_17555 [Pirellulaceae bacterium]|nr:hypothetical protein [Pirellulaceae bacterium]MDG2105562.1 hypothetical protein [Pirellulaceae bacterium]
MPRPEKPMASSGLGCGYLLKLTLLISVLMIVNSYLVGKVVRSFVYLLPDILDDIRLYQFFQIFLPIVVVCIQFWIYDRCKDLWLGRRSGGTNTPEG